MVNLLGKLMILRTEQRKSEFRAKDVFSLIAFSELFNPNSDSYLDMNSAIESGFNKIYQSDLISEYVSRL